MVAEVYVDNDVSAYSGKPRPAWQQLEDVIDLADKHGIELATVTGEVDLSNPTGRLVARMLGAAARHEAEHKAQRQKRQRRQAAEAAGWPVGASVPSDTPTIGSPWSTPRQPSFGSAPLGCSPASRSR
ncbi:MAG: recombinase family protein, partial [Pseudonocardiaceae bacterium]